MEEKLETIYNFDPNILLNKRQMSLVDYLISCMQITEVEREGRFYKNLIIGK